MLQVRKKLQTGDVIGAIDLVNDIDPKILMQNPKLLFHLKQQRLIELIRNKEVSHLALQPTPGSGEAQQVIRPAHQSI